ncbi:MAG: glycoside hydrolase family 26 protein [Gaiellales bacterium]
MKRSWIAAGGLLATLAIPAAALAGTTGSNPGFQLGVFANEPGGISAFEQQLGKTVSIDHQYAPWDLQSWTKKISGDVAANRTPLLSWSAAPKTNAAAIISGSQDAIIKNAATQLKASGRTIYLRPFYEFDQPQGHPRYIGTPAQVIAAWQHTYNVFQSVGATNVKFVWCPMAFDYAKGVAQQFWPGASYVDYVAADGYNFPNQKSWKTFDKLFLPAYNYSVQVGKPFFVAETASPGADSRTPQWITDAQTWAASHTNTAAIVYFDSVSPKGFDFQLLAHPAAFTAYQTWAASTTS